MTLQQLRYAIGIAETGSLNKAAEKLYISQPSLTASIHELEDELNILIFNRTSRGVSLTNDGEEFISYARDLYHNYESLLGKYGKTGARKKRFAVSTQHYSFVVKSFVETVKKFGTDEYEFAVRETRTKEVIEDASTLKSEIGVLYLSEFNRKVILNLLKARDLEFHKIIDCRAYVYLWKNHPLAGKRSVTFDELADYPCLSFEQGDNSSCYFAEEILSENEYHRTIKANDRATMLNLMVGLGGYTLCSGIICEELNGSDYTAVPFKDTDSGINRVMEIGYVTRRNLLLSDIGERFVEEMKNYLAGTPARQAKIRS
ncbi:MAG: LysR family transcriptional regulator [Fibrobacteraceae bacterium]|jgi:DNA-binding transcriptional LysR family regulator